MLPVAQQIEYREAITVHDDRLSIDEAGADGQGRNRLGNQRKTIGEVVAVAREQPHASFVAARQNTEAVVLDLVNPVGPAGRLLSRTGQAWLDGRFGTPEHRRAWQ